MTTTHENGFEIEKNKKLSKHSTDEEIVSCLSKRNFLTDEEIFHLLREIPSSRLERIAKEKESVENLERIVYTVILQREEVDAEIKRERETEETDSIFMTPSTPYNEWSSDIMRFTRLDISVAKKIGAILRGKYKEVRGSEIIHILRKIEHICESPSFIAQEKALAVSLLCIAVENRIARMEYIVHICEVLHRVGYSSARSLLVSYLEECEQDILERLVISGIQNETRDYAWVLQAYLAVHPNRAYSVFSEIKEKLVQYVERDKKENACMLLKPIYIYSTDDMEKEIEQILGEKGKEVLKMCNENIWS